MQTIFIIAWRNIWRNPKRSLVMVAAITAGLWGGIFAASLSFGLLDQRFQATIEQHISHIQVHHPSFIQDPVIEYRIAEWEALRDALSADPDISAFSGRTIINGMLASAHLTKGINIIGTDPGAENSTTGLEQNLIEGSYFEDTTGHPVLIGRQLAGKTKLEVGSRLVLTFQDMNNELVAGAFRVAGIFQTSNTQFDENNVYVRQSDLDDYVGEETVFNEVAMIVSDFDLIGTVGERYRNMFPGLTVRTWAEVSPELSYMNEMAGVMLMIVLGIILFALAFGLVNTMLMSVFERTQELGILMAVGMKRKLVFSMIMMETSFLTLLGALGGLLFGVATMAFFGQKGIDLARVGGDALNEFGFPSVVYPTLEPSFFLMLILLVALTAILSSVFPSLKALRLQPAEAVREQL